MELDCEFPDVPALAETYIICLCGQLRFVRVTSASASAPVLASMATLINNERLSAGERPVGFLKPPMYARPEVFNDVANWDNEGYGAGPAYRAIKGWNLVMGLDSPDFQKLTFVLLGFFEVSTKYFVATRN